jgi:two-component system chemotaxis response regulator CheB
MKRIRVLVVDDSVFMRKAISRMLSLAGDIEVVDTAVDGREAVEKASSLRPDIVTLDVRMAGMDGITALGIIMRDFPTRVLMLSSLTHEGAEVTLKALELGAVDFIDKTRTESSMDIALLANELVAKIRTIAGVDVGKMKANLPGRTESRPEEVPPVRAPLAEKVPRSPRVEVVAIGTSTGGPPALGVIIPRLPANFPSAVVVVQHMPPGFTKPLADRLNAQSKLSVSEAREDDLVYPGRVLVAPAGKHLKLVRKNGRTLIRLSTEPSGFLHKPSVDIMMESVAEACGRKTLGVLLTGMGIDGAKGMRAIKDAGGRTIAESEETCIVYGMPKAAVEHGAADRVVPLHGIVDTILKEVCPPISACPVSITTARTR